MTQRKRAGMQNPAICSLALLEFLLRVRYNLKVYPPTHQS
jgi:hypothetical protein